MNINLLKEDYNNIDDDFIIEEVDIVDMVKGNNNSDEVAVYVSSLSEVPNDYSIVDMCDLRDFISYAKNIKEFEEMSIYFDSSFVIKNVLNLLNSERFEDIFFVRDFILKNGSDNKMVFFVDKSDEERYCVILKPNEFFRDIYETIDNSIVKYLG